jgi:hypothetical protein
MYIDAYTSMHMHSCGYIHIHVYIQPIACGVSILKCQKHVYIRIYIDAYAQLWIHTYTCVYTAHCMWSVYIHMPKTCIHTHIHLCICTAMDTYICMCIYSLLHVECSSIKSSNLNLIGLFSTERGKRDEEN